MRHILFLASALALAATPALADSSSLSGRVKVQSGSIGDLAWTAQSRIVGMTPTSDVLPPNNTIGGGDPIFFPSSNKSGVVALIMDYGPGGAFICSGSLMSDRMSIVTAAHCVSDGFGTPGPLTTTAYFFTGDPNERTPFSPNATTVAVSKIMVNPGYTGFVIDHNDIAVLRLEHAVFGVDAYDIWGGSNLRNENFNVAGYGARSTVGGTLGADARTGFLREGDNRYDYRFGDPDFLGIWYPIIGPQSRTEFSYVSDFDSGLAANDQACRILTASNFNAMNPAARVAPCNTGLGAREVGVAGGDSGGPQFIDGKLASVTSYGLSFGTFWGDCRAGLQSSCGEFSGYVPLYIHTDFIAKAMAVPEPATWAMLIAGFGLVGTAARRRRMATAA